MLVNEVVLLLQRLLVASPSLLGHLACHHLLLRWQKCCSACRISDAIYFQSFSSFLGVQLSEFAANLPKRSLLLLVLSQRLGLKLVVDGFKEVEVVLD